MKFICPTLGDGHEKDFLACGSLDKFKIIVFSNIDEYEKGFKYLNLIDYDPQEVNIDLFKELALNDDAFLGIVLDIHSKNKFISKNMIEELF